MAEELQPISAPIGPDDIELICARPFEFMAGMMQAIATLSVALHVQGFIQLDALAEEMAQVVARSNRQVGREPGSQEEAAQALPSRILSRILAVSIGGAQRFEVVDGGKSGAIDGTTTEQ